MLFFPDIFGLTWFELCHMSVFENNNMLNMFMIAVGLFKIIILMMFQKKILNYPNKFFRILLVSVKCRTFYHILPNSVQFFITFYNITGKRIEQFSRFRSRAGELYLLI